jgi:hypothetical protein
MGVRRLGRKAQRHFNGVASRTNIVQISHEGGQNLVVFGELVTESSSSRKVLLRESTEGDHADILGQGIAIIASKATMPLL